MDVRRLGDGTRQMMRGLLRTIRDRTETEALATGYCIFIQSPPLSCIHGSLVSRSLHIIVWGLGLTPKGDIS